MMFLDLFNTIDMVVGVVVINCYLTVDNSDSNIVWF